ncbi:hypothetical protein [Deinococcus hohokamensis]|uniref:Helix-turn-helix domain-containing protein n=1 Tax=Deinococcus hohokamensis TaxID=309883 RepID=A0ABV9IEZ2_9DEIO
MSAASRPRLVDSRQQFWWGEHQLIDYGVPAHIGTSAWAVYTCLLRHVNAESVTFPSVRLLMAETGLSNRVIGDSIAILKAAELIDVDRKSHQWNVYRILDVLHAIKKNRWALVKEEARDEKSPAPRSGRAAPKQMTKSHQPREEKSPEHVTKSHTKKNHLKTTKEGGVFDLEGDARETPAAPAPMALTSHAPSTTFENAALETTPKAMREPNTSVAVLSPDGEAADAAVTDTDLACLFGDTQGPQEASQVEAGEDVPPAAAPAPHDPEETRALLVPALGGPKNLARYMKETPPGLRSGSRRAWITQISPARASEIIFEGRTEAGAENPWTYIIRLLDIEIGAVIPGKGGRKTEAVIQPGAYLTAEEKAQQAARRPPVAEGETWYSRRSGRGYTVEEVTSQSVFVADAGEYPLRRFHHVFTSRATA